MDYHSNSTQETEGVGERLAPLLRGGDIVAYRGGLGAGKTAFTRGLVRGLGCQQQVTSPTFALVHEYRGGRLPVFHFDCYRLSSAQELWELGWDEYVAQGGVCVLEWSEQVEEVLEGPVIQISLSQGDQMWQRHIVIEGVELREEGGNLHDTVGT